MAYVERVVLLFVFTMFRPGCHIGSRLGNMFFAAHVCLCVYSCALMHIPPLLFLLFLLSSVSSGTPLLRDIFTPGASVGTRYDAERRH